MPELTARQRMFVFEYCVDLDAVAAARRAGYGPGAAAGAGAWVATPGLVKDAVDAALAERCNRLALKADSVVRDIAAVVSADPRLLAVHRRVACRHCHGEGHRYQRTPAEREAELAKWERQNPEGRAPFDELGGVGYNANAEPHPECPECFGNGVSEVFLPDMRTLPSEVARLIASVKQTRDGVEVKTVSREKYLELAGRHLGMWNDKLDVKDERTPDEIRKLLAEVRAARAQLEDSLV